MTDRRIDNLAADPADDVDTGMTRRGVSFRQWGDNIAEATFVALLAVGFAGQPWTTTAVPASELRWWTWWADPALLGVGALLVVLCLRQCVLIAPGGIAVRGVGTRPVVGAADLGRVEVIDDGAGTWLWLPDIGEDQLAVGRRIALPPRTGARAETALRAAWTLSDGAQPLPAPLHRRHPAIVVLGVALADYAISSSLVDGALQDRGFLAQEPDIARIEALRSVGPRLFWGGLAMTTSVVVAVAASAWLAVERVRIAQPSWRKT